MLLSLFLDVTIADASSMSATTSVAITTDIITNIVITTTANEIAVVAMSLFLLNIADVYIAVNIISGTDAATAIIVIYPLLHSKKTSLTSTRKEAILLLLNHTN